MLEVELKLPLQDPNQVGLFLNSAFMQTLAFTDQVLVTTYFDTQRADLQRLKMALRIRQSNENFIQTVKEQMFEANNPLQKCHEWETLLDNNQPNLAAIKPRAIQDKLARAINHQPLQALFTTHFQRRTWHYFTLCGHGIEIVLDQGYIECQSLRLPLCEIELELKQGTDEQCLHALAQRLSHDLLIATDTDSKAKRGYQLAVANGLLVR